MVVSKENPRIPRRPLPADGLKEIKEPVDRPPDLVALQEGVGKSLLAPTGRGLAQPLLQ
jgi:hypothetical protein